MKRFLIGMVTGTCVMGIFAVAGLYYQRNALVDAYSAAHVELVATHNAEMAKLKTTTKKLERELTSAKNVLDSYKVKVPSRIGFANNNPMNIKGKGWLGQKGKNRDAVDAFGHAIFEDIHHGYRAGAMALVNFQRKRGVKTIKQLIDLYCESNKEAYVKHLCKELNVKPDEEIDFIKHLDKMMKAITQFENGTKIPYHHHILLPYSFMANL